MSIITISIGSKIFDLSCPEENKDKLNNLAKILNQKLKLIEKASPNANYDLLLVMLSLNLQDQIALKEEETEQNAVQIQDNTQLEGLLHKTNQILDKVKFLSV